MSVVSKFLGESLRVVGTFTDSADAAVDPTVTAYVVEPDGTQTSVTPTDESGTGIWSAEYDTATDDAEGKYTLVMKGVYSGFTVMETVEYSVTSPN